nr:hypothetical protein C02D4.1 - Caenorhabditis elegans [Caenorhabditis elegans]
MLPNLYDDISKITEIRSKYQYYACFKNCLIVFKNLQVSAYFRRNHVAGTPCLKEIAIENDILDVIKSFEADSSSNSDRAEPASTTSGASSDPDYDHIGTNGGTPIPLLSATTFSSPTKKYRSSADTDSDDYLDQTTFDDVAMMQFDSVQAPFLRSASPYVKSEFQKIWEDQNIPSESLRTLKIQTLAVSLLTSKQLTEYNRWATKRRRVLKVSSCESTKNFLEFTRFDMSTNCRKMPVHYHKKCLNTICI